MQHNLSTAPTIDAVSATLVALAQSLRVTLVVWSDRMEITGDDVTVKRLTPLLRAHEAGVRQCVTMLSEWGAAQARHQYDRVIYFDVAQGAWICRPRAAAIEAACQSDYAASDLSALTRSETRCPPEVRDAA
jgi:hypothetical protein